MRFAENNRISHRQLYRQIVLAFTAPFLLCLFGEGKILGVNGIIGTAAALLLLVFYMIFLIRVSPYYEELRKTAGAFWSRVIGLFFLSYVALTGAFLLALLEEIVPASLVTGVSGKWIAFWAILVCGLGTHKGMQKRGRMAEVSGGLLIGGILVMMVLGMGQGSMAYLQEMVQKETVYGAGILRSGYGVLCAFSGVGLLPFTLAYVEKQGSSGKPAAWGILTVGAILMGMELLLPAVFGWDRLRVEKFPILPLMAGANLPGNVLARFDVLWMGFLLYGLMFAIGSLLHYGHQVIRNAGFRTARTKKGDREKDETGRLWHTVLMGAAVYFLSVWRIRGEAVTDYYGNYLAFIFLPGLLIVQVLLMMSGRRKWRRKMASAGSAAALFLICVGLVGCAGIEPEKRMYPLALGVESTDGGFSMIYGTPDLPKATGQNKEGEEAGSEALTISGNDFAQIEQAYQSTQEKYLDMGHLQVLILGKRLLEDGKWKDTLDYLEKEPFVGENVYVFAAEDVGQVMGWQSGQGTSVGEYLLGMLENREGINKKNGVTLRKLYYEKYRSGQFTTLPEVRIVNEMIKVG